MARSPRVGDTIELLEATSCDCSQCESEAGFDSRLRLPIGTVLTISALSGLQYYHSMAFRSMEFEVGPLGHAVRLGCVVRSSWSHVPKRHLPAARARMEASFAHVAPAPDVP